MASEFLKRKAAESRQRVTKTNGAKAYGGTEHQYKPKQQVNIDLSGMTGKANTQGTRPKGLDPAPPENTRTLDLSMLRNTRETANRVKDIYNAKMIAAEHDAAEDVRGAAYRLLAQQIADEHDRNEITKQTVGERLGSAASSVGKTLVGSLGYLGEIGAKSAQNAYLNSRNDEIHALEQQSAALANRLQAMRQGYGNPTWGSEGEIRDEIAELSRQIDALQLDDGVSPDSFSSRMLASAYEDAARATAGMTGWKKDFADAGLSVAQNLAVLPTAAINPGVPLLLMGAQAAGGRAYELTQQGAGAEEALGRGMLSGAIESMTEKLPLDNLIGIIGKGNMRNFALNILKQAGLEGTEEAVSYVLNYAADKLNKDPMAEFSVDELVQSAKLGAISGGFFGVGGTAVGTALNRAGQEAAPAHTPETQELLHDIEQRLAPVGNVPAASVPKTEGDFADRPAREIASRRENPATLPTTPAINETPVGMKKTAQGEPVRQTVRVDADTENTLNRIAKRGGAQIEIVERIEDGSAGKYLDGKIQINAEKLREDRAGTLRTVVMHEMTHHIETSGQYEDLRKGIESYLKSKGVDVDYELEILAEEYEANGVDLLQDDQIWREYVAKNVETMLSDEESVRYLARENRGLFDKIREFLRDLVTKIKGTQDEKAVRELLNIYDRALDTVGVHPENRYQGEQHLIKRAQDGTSFVEVEEDVLEGADEKDIPRILSDIIQNKFHNLIEANGQQIVVNARTGKEWRRSKDAARLYSQDRTAYHDKIRSFNNADELLNASRDYIGEGLKHVRKDNFVEFARGTVDFRVQGRGYTADVVVGTTKDGRAYLYDVVNLGQKNIADTSLYRHQQNASNDRGDVSANNKAPAPLRAPAYNREESQNGYAQNRVLTDTSSNSISEDDGENNRNNTQNFDQSSVGRSIDELRAQGQQMTPEERKAYVEASRARRAKLRDLADQYGEIPQGERPAREISLPKQTNDDTRVRRFARTAAEASVLSDEQAGAIEQAVLDGVFDYEPIGDQYAVERAEAKILRDAEQAKRDWAAVVNSNDRITKNDIALGELLLKQAAEAGDTQEVIRLTAEIAAAGTQAGQVVQAMRLLKQMGGAGQLAGIDQLTNQYQKDLDKRYGKKAPQLDIPDNLKQDLANAKTEEEIEQAKNAIFKHIASQIPSTWGDKWNAWRYLAMLGNPRTHIRNVLGNALFEPMVGVKNVLGAITETISDPVVKKVRGKGIERTKTLKPASRAVKDFSKADYAEMEEIVKHGGKYNDGQKIDDYRTIFTNKAIEWARKANGKALEKEDGLFLGRHYTRALASYITANNLDVAKLGDGSRESAKLLDKARAYAIREAQKATYRDASQTAELIAQTARRGKAPVRMVLEGVLPFKKTPINILKRGLEYSPAGLVKAVYKGVDGLKNGGYTANEFIDDLAAGLSGSALLGLGYMMTSLGLLTGGGDDEDESKWYKDMLGYQSYALRAGDTTYTLDWMAPGSMPLFVGVELFNLVNGGTLEASDLLGAMELVTAPMNNMSMLSGLNDTLDNLAYGGDTSNALMNLFTDSVLSYLSQAVPTLGGQIARTMDGTRRTTYADPNNAIPDSWEKALQKAGNKIPYLSEKNPAYINLWGETEETENPLYRFATNALSPGYVDTIKVDALDEELLRLYEATGENVFPDSAGKSIRVDGETIKFTVDEFRKYATTLGKTSHEILSEIVDSKLYTDLDDTDRVSVIDMAYQYARAAAKSDVSDYEPDGWIAKAQDAATVDLSPDDYILYKLACEKADADRNGSITQEEAKNAIDSMQGLSRKQKAYLWQSQNKNWKPEKNPYK